MRKQKGITMVVLIITIVIMLILVGATVTVSLNGELFDQTRKAKSNVEISNEKEIIQEAIIIAERKNKTGSITVENIQNAIDSITKENSAIAMDYDETIIIKFTESKRYYQIDNNGYVKQYDMKEPEPTPEDSSRQVLSQMRYGVIEVEFLSDKSYDVTNTANKPILKDGMKAVYWAKDETGEIDEENPANNVYEITSDDENFKEENWYNYIAQSTTTEEGGTSRWANAITSDGSYYVWIPRYSYRIIYFDTEQHENEYRAGTLTEENALQNGYIAGYSDARGIVDAEGKKPTEVSSQPGIAVNDKKFRTHPAFDGNVNEGGWSYKTSGFWVMKYEASKYGDNIPISIPNSFHWWNIRMNTIMDYIKNAYNKNGKLNTILNSHLIKNSEWGAITYLSDSKFGRNGTEVSQNASGAYTGRVSEEYPYNTKEGMLASSAGNIYGIYDLNGLGREYVACYFVFSNSSSESYQLLDRIEQSNEYITLYSQETEVRKAFITGDGIYEMPNIYWNMLPVSDAPFMTRGGKNNNSRTSISDFSSSDCPSSDGRGFRVCLTVK